MSLSKANIHLSQKTGLNFVAVAEKTVANPDNVSVQNVQFWYDLDLVMVLLRTVMLGVDVASSAFARQVLGLMAESRLTCPVVSSLITSYNKATSLPSGPPGLLAKRL